MTLGTFAWLLRQSLISTLDDGCFGYAKAAAYSALLSFFPVLTSAATILVQTRAEFVSATLESFLSQIVPPGTEDLVVQQFRVMGERPAGFLIAAGIISLWAASGVIKSLIEGFQAAYRVPRNRDFFRQSGVVNWMKVDPFLTPFAWLSQGASRIARYVLAFVTTITVTSSLYYYGPYRRQRWHFVWRGATLATILWFFATLGFAWYVRHLARYNVMYGSIGAGIALLVWMYLIALIALIGCEFNATYERAAG